MQYRAIVFDLFGTLVGVFSVKARYHILLKMAQILSAPTDLFVRIFDQETRPQREIGQFPTLEANLKYVCQALNLQVEEQQITKAASLRYQFTRRMLTPRPGVMEIISQLKSKGYQIGLISDCSPEVPVLWQMTPLAAVVDKPIFSCVVGLKKPDRDIYQLLCEQLNVQAQECLYLGDGGSFELSGALEVGMRPILLRIPEEATGDPYRPDAESWGGERIADISELLTLLT